MSTSELKHLNPTQSRHGHCLPSTSHQPFIIRAPHKANMFVGIMVFAVHKMIGSHFSSTHSYKYEDPSVKVPVNKVCSESGRSVVPLHYSGCRSIRSTYHDHGVSNIARRLECRQ